MAGAWGSADTDPCLSYPVASFEWSVQSRLCEYRSGLILLGAQLKSSYRLTLYVCLRCDRAAIDFLGARERALGINEVAGLVWHKRLFAPGGCQVA